MDRREAVGCLCREIMAPTLLMVVLRGPRSAPRCPKGDRRGSKSRLRRKVRHDAINVVIRIFSKFDSSFSCFSFLFHCPPLNVMAVTASDSRYQQVKESLGKLSLNTVCEEAQCPVRAGTARKLEQQVSGSLARSLTHISFFFSRLSRIF